MNDSIGFMKAIRLLPVIGLALALVACGGGGTSASNMGPVIDDLNTDHYQIGAGDGLRVFVWGHEDLTTDVAVRPDGYISTPLVEDMRAAGKTPTELAREIEEELANFIRSPTVTVIVQNFVGESDRQIRVVGQAAEPASIPYRAGMTVLDVIIAVGGLAEFAAGNKAKIVRRENGADLAINVRLNDLLNRGDMRQNVRMRPGDVLIIPESAF